MLRKTFIVFGAFLLVFLVGKFTHNIFASETVAREGENNAGFKMGQHYRFHENQQCYQMELQEKVAAGELTENEAKELLKQRYENRPADAPMQKRFQTELRQRFATGELTEEEAMNLMKEHHANLLEDESRQLRQHKRLRSCHE